MATSILGLKIDRSIDRSIDHENERFLYLGSITWDCGVLKPID